MLAALLLGSLSVIAVRAFAAVEDASLLQNLVARGPHPQHAGKLMLFGQFVGDWDLDVTFHQPDGTTRQLTGEWHFGWVLEGRAVQDVWIVPALKEPRETGQGHVGYGTTIRFYDPRLDAWHVTWNGVMNGSVFRFLARENGHEIVMEAKEREEDGLSRWIFSDVTPRSFRWRSVASNDGGKTWVVDQEMAARRREGPSRAR